MFIYDSYEVGKIYGHDQFRITSELICGWHALYESTADKNVIPVGLIVLIQQQAYKKVITPRPPGHIQGSQRFQVHSLPRVDSVIVTEVSCLSKEIRKERRWVEMRFQGCTDDGVRVYSGVNTVLVPC